MWLESQTEAAQRAAQRAAERKAVLLDAEQRLTAVRMRRLMGTQPLGSWPNIFEKPCKHLKGGRYRLPGHKDYATWCFTFVDGSTIIKCAICGEKWTPQSPDWADAIKMMEQSTNTRCSSEVIYSKLLYSDGKTRTPEEAKAEGLATSYSEQEEKNAKIVVDKEAEKAVE